MVSRPGVVRTARGVDDGDKGVGVMGSGPGFNNKIDRAGGKSRIGIAVQAVAGHAGRAAEAVDSVELAAIEQERVGRGEAGVLDPEAAARLDRLFPLRGDQHRSAFLADIAPAEAGLIDNAEDWRVCREKGDTANNKG